MEQALIHILQILFAIVVLSLSAIFTHDPEDAPKPPTTRYSIFVGAFG